jgi:hypothetical protein
LNPISGLQTLQQIAIVIIENKALSFFCVNNQRKIKTTLPKAANRQVKLNRLNIVGLLLGS